MQRAHRSLRPARLIGLGLLVVLVVAMVLNTKFLNPEELAAAGPVKFDPKATADELFTKAKAELPDKASEVGEVVPAMQADTKAAAEKYNAVSPAEGAYVFPVKTTATVIEATDANLRLKVAGVPEETPVIVPLTTAINGTVRPRRDGLQVRRRTGTDRLPVRRGRAEEADAGRHASPRSPTPQP